MFYYRKRGNINDTAIIFEFRRKCISTKKLFNVRNPASSHLYGPYSQSIQLTQYFAQDLFNKVDIFWKILFTFFPCQTVCWHTSELFIKWTLNLPFSWQVPVVCCLLVLFVVIQNAGSIFSPVLLSFFSFSFLSELEEDKQNVLIYKELLRCPSNPLWISIKLSFHMSNLKDVKESNAQLEKFFVFFFFSALCVQLVKYRNLFPGSEKSCHWNLFKLLALKREQD